MQRATPFATILLLSISVGACLAQTGRQSRSLCDLQEKVAEGAHTSARVSGRYSVGPESQTLQDPACPDESTWIEFALQSQDNKEKLDKILERSQSAQVEFEGEFYGPPLPDPKLPDAIRKTYHPGWGQLAAFKTKFVVHFIRSTEPAPRPAH